MADGSVRTVVGASCCSADRPGPFRRPLLSHWLVARHRERRPARCVAYAPRLWHAGDGGIDPRATEGRNALRLAPRRTRVRDYYADVMAGPYCREKQESRPV